MTVKQNIFPGNWDGCITHDIQLSRKRPVIMAGPCMFESREIGFEVGQFLKNKCAEHDLPYIFKSSYDKANRTSAQSIRGPGVKQGLKWLQELRSELKVPVLTDVHTAEQALEAGKTVDILQIPAFLCKQRDLLIAAASTGKTVQIKKGQWTSAEEMLEIAQFVEKCGNSKVILVERGTCFGYNNLVVDFRNLVEMHTQGHAVVFDATHSVQLPGAGNGKSSGLRHMVHPLVRAAMAIGVDGIFMEVHPNPTQACSDADTQLSMQAAEIILDDIAKMLK
ncbi:3-deoxy-8-phosphooctulonate synthase [Fluviispira sanaruensis]|uniref:3-deoxy-8-phosphooctulonate synthase n=1 Tax=Fluviispira sanaruensis TaxID=2493639 RepID=A0A4P2VM60_FLUSA|nr:3-deoxy-8-phosphooctulonate synthase [Fluviispira sanaruensis]BBH52930.1 3-deoxy-8-phosphooctulonate synthase [Fluviispira sanaruensis]